MLLIALCFILLFSPLSLSDLHSSLGRLTPTRNRRYRVDFTPKDRILQIENHTLVLSDTLRLARLRIIFEMSQWATMDFNVLGVE